MRNMHLGDSNVQIKVTILDECGNIFTFDNTTTIAFYFLKPDSTKFETVGSPFTDGSDGIVQYTVSSSQIDMAGLWSLQVSIFEESSGTTLYTDIYDFRVERQL